MVESGDRRKGVSRKNVPHWVSTVSYGLAILGPVGGSVAFLIKGGPVWVLVFSAAAVAFIGTAVVIFSTISAANYESESAIKRLDDAQSLARSEPEKAKPAWDVARLTLEAYFNRNLRQIDAIFVLSVVVILFGFGLLIWGVALSLRTSNFGITAMVSASGLLTQFIGGTFIVVYRSAIAQAIAYVPTLERINSVGMAMQILDTLTDEDRELSSKTRADLVRLLILQVPGQAPEQV